MNFDVGTFPASVAVGEFNGDGAQDLAVANVGTSPLYADSSISVLLGNGDGTFQPAQSFGAGSGPRSVAVGDFNGDTVQDLAVANGASGDVSVLLGIGDGSFQAAQSFAVGSAPRIVVVGEFNGDGVQDLAVPTGGGRLFNVSVLLGNPDGSFQAPRNFGLGAFLESLAVGDFNGDGLQDLAVAADNGVSVLINNTF